MDLALTRFHVVFCLAYSGMEQGVPDRVVQGGDAILRVERLAHKPNRAATGHGGK